MLTFSGPPDSPPHPPTKASLASNISGFQIEKTWSGGSDISASKGCSVLDIL